MPRILFPTVILNPANGEPLDFNADGGLNVRSAIYNTTFATGADLGSMAATSLNDGATEVGLRVGSVQFLSDGTNFLVARAPTAFANATATGAASTQLVAAVAAKKFMVYGMAISAVATAAATDGVVSINEPGGATLLSMRVSATSAAVENMSISIPTGVRQTTANKDIQVTSIANTTTDATLIYGPAE